MWLQFLTGQALSEDYVEFLEAELSMHGEDPYAQPEIFTVPEATRAGFRVLVRAAAASSGVFNGGRKPSFGR